MKEQPIKSLEQFDRSRSLLARDAGRLAAYRNQPRSVPSLLCGPLSVDWLLAYDAEMVAINKRARQYEKSTGGRCSIVPLSTLRASGT